jgi:hypothetical protein
MFKNIIGTITIISLYSNNLFGVVTFSLPMMAQKPTSQSCSAAKKIGKHRLESIKEISSVGVNQYNLSQQYPDHPTGRDQNYTFSMKGSAVGIVMSSPKFMTSIGQNVIRNCKTVGKVTFALANSGWGISVGLLSDEHIGVFKCLNHPDPRLNVVQKISWGEEYCSL